MFLAFFIEDLMLLTVLTFFIFFFLIVEFLWDLSLGSSVELDWLSKPEFLPGFGVSWKSNLPGAAGCKNSMMRSIRWLSSFLLVIFT